MPATCCIVGCSSRSNRDNVSFFRIPNAMDTNKKENEMKKRRQQAWLSAIARSDLEGKKLKNARVCSRHFITGKPCAEDCDTHPDWAPSEFLNSVKSPKKSTKKTSPSATKINRFCRLQERHRRIS